MERKIVHVVGTGTIGEPLIGILCEQKSNLGIDEVTFHKQSPLTKDAPKIKNLISKGARLSVHEERVESFKEIGLEPEFTMEEAVSRSSFAGMHPTFKHVPPSLAFSTRATSRPAADA